MEDLARGIALKVKPRPFRWKQPVSEEKTKDCSDDATADKRPDIPRKVCPDDHRYDPDRMSDEIKNRQPPQLHGTRRGRDTNALKPLDYCANTQHRQQGEEDGLLIKPRSGVREQTHGHREHKPTDNLHRPCRRKKIRIITPVVLHDRRADPDITQHRKPLREHLSQRHQTEGLGEQQSSQDEIRYEPENLLRTKPHCCPTRAA